MSTHTGLLPVKVIDSIGENKAKLIECGPEDLPALRASHPSLRILPVVYYQRAVVRYHVEAETRAVGTRVAAKTAAAERSSISITIVASDTGKPVAARWLWRSPTLPAKPSPGNDKCARSGNSCAGRKQQENRAPVRVSESELLAGASRKHYAQGRLQGSAPDH
jgi:hypothetical protein